MKFGIARTEIIPSSPMPMGGYGMVDPFDEVHDPLTLTAVYFNDGTNEAWTLSADLGQFPNNPFLQQGLDALSKRLKCRPESIFLNASHTHGAPLMYLAGDLDTPERQSIYGEENMKLILGYFDFLWERCGHVMEQSRAAAQPGTLHYGEGPTNFPINRRKLVNGRVEMEPDPEGIIDDRLRMLVIKDSAGEIRIILPTIACHPTSAGSQHRLTADYVGAWRRQLEEAFDGRVQMAFLQGCGGDLRPAYTRHGEHFRRIPLQEFPNMGRHLVRETFAALAKGLRDVGPLDIQAASGIFLAPCEHSFPDRGAYEALLANEREAVRNYAQRCLKILDRGETVEDKPPLNLHYFQLAKDLALLGMDFEPVCGLGMSIEKAMLPQHTLALGYTDGCFGYVPDETELQRGGYEAEAYIYDIFSGPFKPGIEKFVGDSFQTLRKKAR